MKSFNSKRLCKLQLDAWQCVKMVTWLLKLTFSFTCLQLNTIFDSTLTREKLFYFFVQSFTSTKDPFHYSNHRSSHKTFQVVAVFQKQIIKRFPSCWCKCQSWPYQEIYKQPNKNKYVIEYLFLLIKRTYIKYSSEFWMTCWTPLWCVAENAILALKLTAYIWQSTNYLSVQLLQNTGVASMSFFFKAFYWTKSRGKWQHFVLNAGIKLLLNEAMTRNYFFYS